MINQNEKLEITTTGYLPQFNGNIYKYYNANFFVISESLKKIYLNKYANKKYQFTINPFKAEEI